ncbi:MAG: hypothetical protein KDC92_04870, partial [Bacteroidetes bacterium]|nr:hypothetical protein [Bacteroidota bacterium]
MIFKQQQHTSMPIYRLALLAFLALPISLFAQTSDEEVLNQLDSLYALYKANNAPQVIRVKHLYD